MRFVPVLAAILALLAPSVRAMDWDLKRDWIEGANPMGPWALRSGSGFISYQQPFADPDSFATGFSAYAMNSRAQNHLPLIFKSKNLERFNHNWSAGDVVVHSRDVYNGGPNGHAAISWTSPVDGAVTISGSLWNGMGSNRNISWSLSKGGDILTTGLIMGGNMTFANGANGPAAVTNIPVKVGDSLVLTITPPGANEPGEYVGVDFKIGATTEVDLSAELFETGSGPLPPQIPPSVYRAGSANSTPLKLQIIRVAVKAQNEAVKNVRVWIEPVLNSGSHMHGPLVRPSGYLLDINQINPLKAAFAAEPRTDFVGGAFNPSETLEYAVAYTTSQRAAGKAGLPTNSYANGINVALQSGDGVFYYVAPEIAGIENIVASTISDNPSQRSKSQIVATLRFPGLIPVPESSTGVMWVGNPDPGHNMIGLGNGRNATPEGKNALLALARQYYADNLTSPRGGLGRLPLNDAALPWGGMFDYSQKYTYGSHYGHRDGAEFDISTAYPYRAFERILLEQPFWRIDEALWIADGTASPHYHIRLLPTSAWRKGPSMQLKSMSYSALTSVDRSRTIRVKFVNRGAYRGSGIVDSITATGGATVQTLPIAFVADPTKLTDEFAFTVRAIPVGGTTVTILGTGSDVTGNRNFETILTPPNAIPSRTDGIRFVIPG